MAIPEDQSGRMRCYRNALNNWKYDGYLDFKKASKKEWLRENLPGRPVREIKRLLFEHVAAGGIIDEQVELRPEYVKTVNK